MRRTCDDDDDDDDDGRDGSLSSDDEDGSDVEEFIPRHRGASGARAAASNHWRLQLQQRAAARSIDLMGAAKNQKEAGG